jgi:hypothetical protein
MKNVTSNFALILFVFVAVCLFTGIGFGQDLQKQSVQRRIASETLMREKSRSLSEEESAQLSAKYRGQIESVKAGGGQNAPGISIWSVGSTHTGLTVNAHNNIDLPDGTVMYASKTINGAFIDMSWTSFSGTFPAGLMSYPLEDGKRTTWTDRPGLIVYEVYLFFPDNTVSYAQFVKPQSQWWSGANPIQKLITDGTARFIGNQAIATLQGPITSVGPISVMVLDPEVGFSQKVVPFNIVGNNLRVNLSGSNFDVYPNMEVTIMVTAADGRTGQYNVVVKGSENLNGKQ